MRSWNSMHLLRLRLLCVTAATGRGLPLDSISLDRRGITCYCFCLVPLPIFPAVLHNVRMPWLGGDRISCRLPPLPPPPHPLSVVHCCFSLPELLCSFLRFVCDSLCSAVLPGHPPLHPLLPSLPPPSLFSVVRSRFPQWLPPHLLPPRHLRGWPLAEDPLRPVFLSVFSVCATAPCCQKPKEMPIGRSARQRRRRRADARPTCATSDMPAPSLNPRRGTELLKRTRMVSGSFKSLPPPLALSRLLALPFAAPTRRLP